MADDTEKNINHVSCCSLLRKRRSIDVSKGNKQLCPSSRKKLHRFVGRDDIHIFDTNCVWSLALTNEFLELDYPE